MALASQTHVNGALIFGLQRACTAVGAKPLDADKIGREEIGGALLFGS